MSVIKEMDSWPSTKVVYKMKNTADSVYLDFNATAPTSVEVQKFVEKFIKISGSWGNPSSIHWASRVPKLEIREAHKNIAKVLGCAPLEVIFTSGGSESNASILRSVFDAVFLEKSMGEKCEFITSCVEHPSVLKSFKYFESLGAKVHYISVNRQGQLDLEQYRKLLSNRTALVSIMWANNETGVIHPIKQLCALAHQAGALFHTDAVQTLGKFEINLHDSQVDFASFSGHKFYALKGIGVLYSRKGSRFHPLILGGGQERHRRGGTENVLGLASFAEMSKQRSKITEQAQRLEILRDHFEARVLAEIPSVTVTAKESLRLANTSSLVLSGVDGETLLMALDLRGFAVSTGAACSSGNPEPSPVLLSMGLTRQEAQNSLRVSLGWCTSLEEIEKFIDVLKEVVLRLRSFGDMQEIEV